jgi:pimeloyl-ACP methyl ester carboxylesterase
MDAFLITYQEVNMVSASANAGYFRNGCPYNRFGSGPEPLVILQGLWFENQPASGFIAWGMLSGYKFLGEAYTVYAVTRKPGLPDGYTLPEMAGDYATVVQEEFGQSVDVIGVSTGGSIAMHFAADHPDLVRRLIIHSSAHTLSPYSKGLQIRIARLAELGRWREAYATLFEPMLPVGFAGRVIAGLGGALMARGAPRDASDLVITVEAEDAHAFHDRLGEITSPTLVVAGTDDPFYTEDLFRETAAGIPDARLVLYEGKGPVPSGKQFEQDVRAFLLEKPSSM